MAQSNQPAGLSQVVMLAAGAVVVAGLYLARDVLIPVALAILFSFLLAPLVRRVERIGLGRISSVLVVVALAAGVILGIGYLVTTQLISLTYQLPEYRDNIRGKMQALRISRDGGLGRVTQTIREISEDLTTTQPTTTTAAAESGPASVAPRAATPAGPAAIPPPTPPDLEQRSPPSDAVERPIPVQIVEPTSTWDTAREAFGYLAGPIGTAAIVAVLVIFMLIQREDLRDRFISLMGRGRINVTTIAMDDAASRISRYLLMQLFVNASYGVPVGIALYLIGVPNALLWGLLATLLRYLPYVGPWIAASMPILLSLAVFNDWWHVAVVVAVFIVLELISNNVLEPYLYGSSTGLSTVAVLLAAVFWTWLWGPVGLFLATPMTACLAVMGKHIPRLEFLNILLGDEPVFDPQTRFYQRLLAMDQEEALDLMEEYFEKGTLLQAYDNFLLPAVHIAEQERHGGRIDADRHQFVLNTIRSMVTELGELKIQEERAEVIAHMRESAQETSPAARSSDPAGAEPRAPQLLPEGFLILCVPSRDEADEIVALMLAQVLEAKGYQSQHLTITPLKSELVQMIRDTGPEIVCLSAMPPGALTHARYVCKRLAAIDNLDVIVGLWDTQAEPERLRNRLACTPSMQVVRNFTETLEHVRRITQRHLSQGSGARAQTPPDDQPSDAPAGLIRPQHV